MHSYSTWMPALKIEKCRPVGQNHRDVITVPTGPHLVLPGQPDEVPLAAFLKVGKFLSSAAVPLSVYKRNLKGSSPVRGQCCNRCWVLGLPFLGVPVPVRLETRASKGGCPQLCLGWARGWGGGWRAEAQLEPDVVRSQAIGYTSVLVKVSGRPVVLKHLWNMDQESFTANTDFFTALWVISSFLQEIWPASVPLASITCSP